MSSVPKNQQYVPNMNILFYKKDLIYWGDKK